MRSAAAGSSSASNFSQPRIEPSSVAADEASADADSAGAADSDAAAVADAAAEVAVGEDAQLTHPMLGIRQLPRQRSLIGKARHEIQLPDAEWLPTSGSHRNKHPGYRIRGAQRKHQSRPVEITDSDVGLLEP